MNRPIAPLGVLIVEDEALLAMDLEAMVEDTGHSVIAEAASLPDVEDLVDTLDPAIAFVDVQLARGSCGLDVARLIGQRWPSTVIVFVTANPLKVPPNFAGTHGVIAKPFSRTGLISAMHYIAASVMALPAAPAKPASFIAFNAFANAFSAEPAVP